MHALERTLTQAWLSRGPLAWALWPLSVLLSGIALLRRHAYAKGWLASERLPVPVVVVGNRIAGGAGKTPTTIAVLQHLQARGWHPGVLTRGHGGAHGGQPLCLDAGSADRVDAALSGDEPQLIWRRTRVPIMIDAQRVRGGRSLLAAHPEIDILVCDDGLQHLRLQRDVDIIVFDERGVGNGWVLPAGPLREPLDVAASPGLCAPELVLYNAPRPATHLPGHLAQAGGSPLVPLADWWAHRTPTLAPLTPEDSHAQPVGAMAGIAHPQRFFDSLLRQGWRIAPLPQPDHADYSRGGDLPWPASWPHLIVTEKDAVKLHPDRVAALRPTTQVWVAGLDFRPDTAFWAQLDAALAACR